MNEETQTVSRETLKRILVILMLYRGSVDMALACACYALGFADLYSVRNQAELAQKLGVSKAHVNHMLKRLQWQMPELKPIPGQRTAKACQNMSTARKAQLI